MALDALYMYSNEAERANYIYIYIYKTFMMISNQKTFWSLHGLYKIFQRSK